MARPADDWTRPLQIVPEAEPDWVLGGRYRVLHRLGSGGTAEVFRARDQVLEREVAVKVFRTLAVDDGSSGERRQLELTALARLNHPNLVALLDGCLDPGTQPYLVLEFVDGPNLDSRLRDGPLPEPEVRIIATQVADALAYAHARGTVHRDVKPANILLGSDGPDGTMRARLSDFGTVRLVDSARMTAPAITMGTASYLSPEQARGGDVDAATDIYSLGLVLIEALSGRRCFSGLVHEALAARLTRSPAIPQGLPEPWPRLLAAMTARVPMLRPAAAAVGETLRTGAAATLAGRVPAPDPVPSLRPATVAVSRENPFGRNELAALHTASWFSRHAWLLIAALLAAGLGIGVALTLAGHPDQSNVVEHGQASSGTRHPSSATRSTSPPASSAPSVSNPGVRAPAVVASRHVRSSLTVTTPVQRPSAHTTQPTVQPPTTSAHTAPPSTTPSATPSSSTATSHPASTSPNPSSTPPSTVTTSPTPTPTP